jgi:type II secretory pathway pseudopilin PulG
MKAKKSREAFSLLTAIVVIVLMATVAMFVMSLSGKIVKSTTAQFQREQAELYAKSYTEYAVLAVTGNDRSSNCLQTINGTIGSPTTGNGYDINVNIAYIGTTTGLGTCPALNTATVNTPETPLTIIIDAYVNYKDPDNTSGPWLTVHRRSVQKI